MPPPLPDPRLDRVKGVPGPDQCVWSYPALPLGERWGLLSPSFPLTGAGPGSIQVMPTAGAHAVLLAL